MSQTVAPWILSEGLAGLQAQALGLAEAGGLTPDVRVLRPSAPWKWIAARLWPRPLSVVAGSLRAPLPDLVIGCGGMAAAVLAALRDKSRPVVQVQNPRMAIGRFDLIVANRHDELTGPNVILTRTALHRVTPQRLAAGAERWRERFALLPRPLVAVLLGGNNGRYRLDAAVGAKLAAELATMMRRDKVGVMVTPSRRTDPAVTAQVANAITPLGGWAWDGVGEKSVFRHAGAGGCDRGDAGQRVNDLSEAAATAAPVAVAELPGRSRRQGLFLKLMCDEDRVRLFDGRFAPWRVTPMNDTQEAAAAMRQRLGL